MKLHDDAVKKIPAPHMAIFIDAGVISPWPHEVTSHAARFWKARGYYAMLKRCCEVLHVPVIEPGETEPRSRDTADNTKAATRSRA